jgi:hypothetical protein
VTTGEWYVLSDLHLNGEPGRRGIDGALCGFLENVVSASASTRRTLVLLGDTFDLHGPVRQPTSLVAERLTRLAEAHQGITDALGACVRSGVGLHVVGGNHDIELARPSVAARFTSLLGLAAGHAGVRSSPWLVHVPGVFYAEHGSQHHELNRMPTVLSVVANGDAGDELPVPPLGAASPARPWCPVDDARAIRVARSVVATRRQERLTRTAWYQALLAREAADLDLSGQAIAELAATSRFGIVRAVGGAGWRSVERRMGRARPGAHLARRAAAIHRILSRHGTPAAAYVFGHDHRAARLELAGEPPAAYLNAGTWSDDVRSRGPDLADPQLFPYVRITATSTGVDADLAYWRAPREGPAR